jgi:hypothetical protein
MPLWLINPGMRNDGRPLARRGAKCRTRKGNPRGNPAHPRSHDPSIPLTFREGIGGGRRYTEPPIYPITRAEREAHDRIKAEGVYIPRAERGEGAGAVVVRPARAPRTRRLVHRPRTRAARKRATRHMTHTHWHPVKKHQRRTNPSHAQLVQRKRFAAAARAGTLRKGVRLSSAAKARPARRRTNPARRTEASPMARKKRRRRRSAVARHRRRRVHTTNPRRRRRRTHVMRANPHRRRRRHRVNSHRRTHRRRRNPGFNVRGIGGQVIEAGKHTAVIVIAQAATNRVSSMVPFGAGSVPATIAKQVAVGVLLSYLARRFMPRFANDVLIGALLAPVTTALRMVPVVGASLSGAPPGLGLYPRAAPQVLRGAPPGLGRGMGLYNNGMRQGMGSYMDIRPPQRGMYYD